MNQGSGYSRFLGSAALAGAIAILGLAWAVYTFYENNKDTQTELENQAIQIAQQQTQIALVAQQNQLQSQQLTLAVEQSKIQGQLLTPLSPDNSNSSLTATALSIQASRVEATSQSIATKQKGIEATQTAIASQNTRVTFTVFADRAWQDTGITVNGGDLIMIQYVSGLWRWTGDRTNYDGMGDPAANGTYLEICTTNHDCPITDAPLQSLVGRIGLNGTPFLIGNGLTLNVLSSVGLNRQYMADTLPTVKS